MNGQGQPPAGDPKVRITWNLHWACNYRCEHCFFKGHWEEYGSRNVYRGAAEWESLWRRLLERHGRAFILMTGGEPFLYPEFIDLLCRLTPMHWPINISTNASRDLEEFVRRVDLSRVTLSPSFQPGHRSLEDFLKTVRFLRESRVQLGCINFVAYPPVLERLPEIAAALGAQGESLKVIPFVGEWQGRRYPDGYDEAQRRLLGMDGGWVESKRRRGSLCAAGNRSALLLPDGSLTRCGQIGDAGIFGRVGDGAFPLMDVPKPCDAELCPCDEWKVLPDEQSPAAPGAWLP
ncbi:MAG: radical SAM protein [Elusimicrobiota bacterium]|jgi:MoaA/NifB/PqqE/SkfB family radical SAM enzyme